MLDVVPPFVPVLVAAAIAAVAPRKVGHAVGFLATAGVAVVSLLAPAGTHVPYRLFGFDAVLYQVDEFSRLMGVIFGLIGAAAVLYAYSSEAEGTMTAAALGYDGPEAGADVAQRGGGHRALGLAGVGVQHCRGAEGTMTAPALR
jgi:multicomponent Na+:H+ antiporter subunit D